MGEENRGGNYWLFIQGGDLKAAFCLSRKEDADEDSIKRRALAAWLAEQDRTEKPNPLELIENSFEDL